MNWQSVSCYRITVDYCMVIPAGAYRSKLRNLMGWLVERQSGSGDVIGYVENTPKRPRNLGVHHVASPFQLAALNGPHNMRDG